MRLFPGLPSSEGRRRRHTTAGASLDFATSASRQVVALLVLAADGAEDLQIAEAGAGQPQIGIVARPASCSYEGRRRRHRTTGASPVFAIRGEPGLRPRGPARTRTQGCRRRTLSVDLSEDAKRRVRGPAAPAARPGRAAVAGCLQAGQSAATSKRTGLSLSWRSSHQRPYPSRCWKGRQPGISALRPDCCINVEFRKSTELVAGAPAPRCRSARRTSSSTRMRAACWGTQWPASSKRTGRVARHQSDSQRS
jgi:hypothetical protein